MDWEIPIHGNRIEGCTGREARGSGELGFDAVDAGSGGIGRNQVYACIDVTELEPPEPDLPPVRPLQRDADPAPCRLHGQRMPTVGTVYGR